jgi:hypothetical protein
MNPNEEFYVCPNHTATGGYESCCSCGGWLDDEEERLCTEAKCLNS